MGGVTDYLVYLQRPMIAKVRRRKLVIQFILGLVYGLAVMLLLGKELDTIIGNTLLAAGLLPFLLSLPLVIARLSLSESAVDVFFRDWEHASAYIVNVSFVAGACVLLIRLNGVDDFRAALAEVFSEAVLISLVFGFLAIPVIQDDATDELLSKEESLQLERSQSLLCEWAGPVDLMLEKRYSKDLTWLYPAGMGNFKELGLKFKTSEELQDYLLNGVAPGWDSPWFITALARCDLDTLGSDIILRLNSCLSGASPNCSRIVTESAITTLGNLYFNTGDAKISSRLYMLWTQHEISDVRNACEIAMKAINQPELVAFLDQLLDTSVIVDYNVAARYFKSRFVSIIPLQATTLHQIEQYLASPSHDVRVMALIASCLFFKTPRENKVVHSFLNTVKRVALRDMQETHVIATLAFQALGNAVAAAKGDMSKRMDIWQSSIQLLRISIFKSVRAGAHQLLEASGYQHLSLYGSFSSKATDRFINEGFAPEVLQSVMRECWTDDLMQKALEKVNAMSNVEAELDALFDSYEDKLSVEPIDDPAILLFTKLAYRSSLWKVSDLFIQSRLNSPDRFDRYVGLLCIGCLQNHLAARKMKKAVVPSILSGELISDVRDLALAVLEDQFAQRNSCGFRLNLNCFQIHAQSDSTRTLVTNEKKLLTRRIATQSMTVHSFTPEERIEIQVDLEGDSPMELLQPVEDKK